MGERPSLALLNPAASARVALAEAILNLAAADIADTADIKVSPGARGRERRGWC